MRYRELELRLFRRHLKGCPHRSQGRAYTKCSCPIWHDGDRDGREFRRSLKTRSWDRAIRRLATLEANPEAATVRVSQAIAAWKADLDIEDSTRRKIDNLCTQFEGFCKDGGVELIGEFTQDHMSRYKAARCVRLPDGTTRPLGRITWTKELQRLRQFFGFCVRRRWTEENWAKAMSVPKFKPPKVVPYTPEEMARILAACDEIGRSPYERLRARAMVLLLRHTGLRISDVALLEKTRVQDGQVLLHTVKTGGQVVLPVAPEVEAALDRLPMPRRADGRRAESGYFFWNGITSCRSAVGMAARTLAAAFKRSGVPGAHPHRFRHTLATSILASGGTMADVADVLGISEHIARRHYAKWTVARQDRITTIMSLVQASVPGTPRGHGEKRPVIN